MFLKNEESCQAMPWDENGVLKLLHILEKKTTVSDILKLESVIKYDKKKYEKHLIK